MRRRRMVQTQQVEVVLGKVPPFAEPGRDLAVMPPEHLLLEGGEVGVFGVPLGEYIAVPCLSGDQHGDAHVLEERSREVLRLARRVDPCRNQRRQGRSP